MPTSEYKEARVCVCGYNTFRISSWYIHNKSCKGASEAEQLKCQVATLEKQLENTKRDEQLQELKEDKEQLREQLAATKQELNDQREDLRMFEQLLAERFVELKEEVKQLKKRKTVQPRIARSEPERRKIAQRQNWNCASDTCNLAGKLEAYDLDHVVPLWKGGEDTEDNLQALCPACHRIKTDKERLEHQWYQVARK